MIITKYEDRPAEFWALMGRFFARRQYRREMPYLIDDEGYIWFLAMAGDTLLGFVALRQMKDAAVISGLYVLEDERGKGIAGELIAAELEECRTRGIRSVKTTASPASVNVFGIMGFTATGTAGKYTRMEATLNDDTVHE